MVGKDDAVVVVSAKAVPIVPLCQVSGTRDVVGLQCVYPQHPPFLIPPTLELVHPGT